MIFQNGSDFHILSRETTFKSVSHFLTSFVCLSRCDRRAVFDEKRKFIYSIAVWGDVVVSGGGDGMILAHDLQATRQNSTQRAGRSQAHYGSCSGAASGGGGHFGLLWGLGASSQGAVRAIGITGGQMAAASDDGSVLVYTFPQ